MPKLKTRKAVSQRFKIKKTGKTTKILKRHDGQDHFNARQTGKKKRTKRSDNVMAKTATQKTILRAVPHK